MGWFGDREVGFEGGGILEVESQALGLRAGG